VLQGPVSRFTEQYGDESCKLSSQHRAENEYTKYFQTTGQMRLAFFGVNSVIVKVKIKVNFTLEQATKAQMGSRDIALLFL